jgi:hypothetical protein
MYISFDTDNNCDLLHDRPVLPPGMTPRDKQNRNCLDYSQSWSSVPEGLNVNTDWLTDWLTDCLADRLSVAK